MTRPQLAIVSENLNPAFPAGQQALQLALALTDRAYDVSLICAGGVKERHHENIAYHFMGVRPPLTPIGLMRFSHWQQRLRKDLQPDHTVSLTAMIPGQTNILLDGTVAGAPKNQRRGFLSRTPLSYSGACARLEHRAIADEDNRQWLVANDAIKAELLALAPELEPKIKTLKPIALDHPAASTESQPTRADFARAIGLPIEAKWIALPFINGGQGGVEPMVLALKRLIDDGIDAFLLLAGPWRYTHLLWIAQLGLRERVRFMGQSDDPVAMFAVCDAIAIPAAHDLGGWPTLEALASGRPVVTTRGSGAADRVQGQGGVVLDNPADAAELAQTLAEMLTIAPQAPLGPPRGPHPSIPAALTRALLEALFDAIRV